MLLFGMLFFGLGPTLILVAGVGETSTAKALYMLSSSSLLENMNAKAYKFSSPLLNSEAFSCKGLEIL